MLKGKRGEKSNENSRKSGIAARDETDGAGGHR
jgi:hypothetical protein